MQSFGPYLKKHTELLVTDVGIEKACELTGKSKATLGRYYADHDEHADRFIPVDAVAALEQASSYPHVTSALAELNGISLSFEQRRDNDSKKGGVNSDVSCTEPAFCNADGRIPSIHRRWCHQRKRSPPPTARNSRAATGSGRYETAPGR